MCVPGEQDVREAREANQDGDPGGGDREGRGGNRGLHGHHHVLRRYTYISYGYKMTLLIKKSGPQNWFCLFRCILYILKYIQHM